MSERPFKPVPRPSNLFSSEVNQLLCLVAIQFLLVAFDSGLATNLANWLTPGGMVLVIGNRAWADARRDPGALWTPMFWYRVSTALYFGFGSLIPLFANQATLQYIEALYRVTAEEQAKLNSIVIVSVTFTLIAAQLVETFLPSRPDRENVARTFSRTDGMLAAGITFWCVGAVYKLFISLPRVLGWITLTVPGAISNLGVFSDAGLFLITTWVVRRYPRAWPLLVLMVGFDVVTGLLTFSKLEVLLPGIMFGLGLLTAGVTLLRSSIILVSFFASLSLLQPMIAHARAQQALHEGSVYARTTIQARASYLFSYFGLMESARDRTGIQSSFARLSYVSPAAFVVSRYDAGSPGNSLRYALVTLVPRFVWPTKPLTTDVGIELATLATGRQGLNSIAPGWYAEAYWNLGWGGLPLLMIPVGILLGLLSWVSYRLIEHSDWLSLPVLFIGVRIASRVDGQIVADVIGPTAILLGYAAALVPIRAALATRRAQLNGAGHQ